MKIRSFLEFQSAILDSRFLTLIFLFQIYIQRFQKHLQTIYEKNSKKFFRPQKWLDRSIIAS